MHTLGKVGTRDCNSNSLKNTFLLLKTYLIVSEIFVIFRGQVDVMWEKKKSCFKTLSAKGFCRRRFLKKWKFYFWGRKCTSDYLPISMHYFGYALTDTLLLGSNCCPKFWHFRIFMNFLYLLNKMLEICIDWRCICFCVPKLFLVCSVWAPSSVCSAFTRFHL